MDFYDDDDDKPSTKRKKGDDEFECPECNAHNPLAEPIVDGGEVQCFYCGVEFKAIESGSKFKFKAV